MKKRRQSNLLLAFVVGALSAIGAPAVIAQEPADHDLPHGAGAFAAPDKELMVPVEGGKVWVRITGDIETSDKTPVIFIHGGPGGTHAPFAAMLGLADERPVILYDQLGSGKSERPDNPDNWRVDRFIEELEAVRVALNVERLHLVGISWGAAVALEYTARYPARAASTVLGGTFISTTHWLTDANLLVQELSSEERATLDACESDTPPDGNECRRVFQTVYSRHYNRPKRPEVFSAYTKHYGGQGFNPLIYNKMWGPSEFSSTGSLRNYDATLKLRDLDGKKTMFLIGQYDSARIDTVQEFVALTPGAELAVVPGGGHGFLIDRPHETEAILRGWLQRKDAK